MKKEELRLNKKEKLWIIYGMILFIYFCISAFLTKNIAWVSVAFMWLGFSVIEYFNAKIIKLKDLTIQAQEKFIQSMIKNTRQSMLSKGEIKKN